MIEKYVHHPQDKNDFKSQIDSMRYPYIACVYEVSPEKDNPTEYKKKSRLNAFLHRGVIPVFSKVSGYMEDEAKNMLQIRFALVEEHTDHYVVESISGMSVNRLIKFIEDSQAFLVINFGERANELLIENRNRLLKTKKVKK